MAGSVIARNAKTVVSAIGGVLAVAASVTALAQYAPAGVWAPAGGVLTALEVLRSVNVWLVRNEPLIEQAAGAVGELVDDIHTAATTAAAPPGGDVGAAR